MLEFIVEDPEMKLVSICLLAWFIGCGFALRCATSDGLSVEEAKKVVKKCMKRVTRTDSDTNNYEEYESFDRRDRDGGNRYDSFGSRSNSQSGRNFDTGRANERSDSSRNQFSFPQRSNFSDRRTNKDDRQNHDSPRNNFNVGNHMPEKDKACILQCFFQELKMTNDEGFPDKHKTLQALTKDLRDRELRDFHADSIQECFHMMETSNDSKQRSDNCFYSKSLLACLAERARMNCADWDGETVIF